MGWDVSELRPLTGLLLVPTVIYEYGEPQRNYTDSEKLKNSKINLSQCHLVHHKSHMDWPGREPGPCHGSSCQQPAFTRMILVNCDAHAICQPPVTSSLLGANTALRTLFSSPVLWQTKFNARAKWQVTLYFVGFNLYVWSAEGRLRTAFWQTFPEIKQLCIST
jgi:hypothetical protein